jgi:hypothetical protein
MEEMAQEEMREVEWALKHTLKQQCIKKVVSMMEGFWKVAQLTQQSTNLLSVLRKCVKSKNFVNILERKK